MVLLLKLRYELKLRDERALHVSADHPSQPFIAASAFARDKSLTVELDAVKLMAVEDADDELHQLSDDGFFWNSDGAAVGTELVEGHSDIIRTDALLERLKAQSEYDGR